MPLLTMGYSARYTAHWSLFRSCVTGCSGTLQGQGRQAHVTGSRGAAVPGLPLAWELRKLALPTPT